MEGPASSIGTSEESKVVLDLTKPSTSDAIRTMLEEGKSVPQIAKALGIRYNFAYNVASIYVDRKYRMNIKTWLKERKASETNSN